MIVAKDVRIAIFAVIAYFIGATWPTSCFAIDACNKQWQYRVSDIQEGRRLIKSDRAFTAISPRVDCAKAIIDSLDTLVDQKCNDCAPEYSGLLSDSAFYMRKAFEELDEIKYIEMEISARTKLHNFLLDEEHVGIRQDYFGGNLAALADSMERAGQANEFQALISDLDKSLINNKEKKNRIFILWVKAVRSCPKWDFKPVPDSLDSLKTVLCTDACKGSFDELYEQLKKTGLTKANGKVKAPPMPLLPSPEDCGSQL